MANKNRKPFANPFGKLKGFCASAAEKGPANPPQAPPVQAEAADDADLFAREMDRLGVKERASQLSVPADPPSPRTEKEPPSSPDEKEIFLSALGRMDVSFADDIPEGAETAAAPRRMKLVRQGKLAPEASLDLHGLDRVQAVEKVKFFLENALWQGRRTVLVITGRGVGSGGEPVVRQAVEAYLTREGTTWVREWGRAPARHGGEGALVIFLRDRKK